jgi:hypothetical protein
MHPVLCDKQAGSARVHSCAEDLVRRIQQACADHGSEYPAISPPCISALRGMLVCLLSALARPSSTSGTVAAVDGVSSGDGEGTARAVAAVAADVASVLQLPADSPAVCQVARLVEAGMQNVGSNADEAGTAERAEDPAPSFCASNASAMCDATNLHHMFDRISMEDTCNRAISTPQPRRHKSR